jgi:hypothetical protein
MIVRASGNSKMDVEIGVAAISLPCDRSSGDGRSVRIKLGHQLQQLFRGKGPDHGEREIAFFPIDDIILLTLVYHRMSLTHRMGLHSKN